MALSQRLCSDVLAISSAMNLTDEQKQALNTLETVYYEGAVGPVLGTAKRATGSAGTIETTLSPLSCQWVRDWSSGS